MELGIKILVSVTAIYFAFYSFYWLLTTLLGVSYRPRKPDLLTKLMGYVSLPKKSSKVNHTNPEILLILPAYKPGQIFLKVVESIKQASEGKNIRVYVLLQEAEPHFRTQLRKYGFWVEKAEFGHLPGNSYHHALRHIIHKISYFQQTDLINPDFVMLIDKDNLLASDFFEHITPYDYLNNDVIQAQRCSINSRGDISFFDSISERLNDTMFRSAKSLVKGTIEISGSGALIRTELFKEAINNLDHNAPGYDKNFMVQMLSTNDQIRTVFLPYVQLFEEKTSELESYNPQRVRWFGEQYYNALYSAGKLMNAGIRHGRFSAFEYLITLWRPPRSVQLLLVPMLGVLEIGAYFWMNYWWLGFPYFLTSTLALVTAAVIFLGKEGLLSVSLQHVFSLPKLAISNLMNAGVSIKKENHGKFIHTEHKL
uniref:Glycosyltransferase n=1 Tax=Roseihalotalea indica TaxID=2867963 RepID=A0AA49GJK5_9BACT|nr:glycosyltransferase [Tunicatimonas sp. TK19036]